MKAELADYLNSETDKFKLNQKIKRADFRGWTIHLFNYSLEYVSYKHRPTTLALYKHYNSRLVWRIGGK